MRSAIVATIQEAREAGLTFEKSCDVLGLSPRNVERWMNPPKPKNREPRKPPVNALTPRERLFVESMIRDAEYADHSARELSLALLEEMGVYVSHVTFWDAQVRMNCNGPRRGKRLPRGRGNKPDTSWVTGPNQLWSWDITHLPTGRPYEFWYLYALMDWFSRKVVAWLITDDLLSASARELWDLALLNEDLLMKPMSEWPKSLSDRGTQMRSISTKRYFQRIGVAQMFARPRTPNDNAKTEALFSVVKTEPEYPGCFPAIADARAYFTEFFLWFNEGHPHTALKMLTPSQVHSGEGPAILAARENARNATLDNRRKYHLTGRENLHLQALAPSCRRALPIRFQYPCSVVHKEAFHRCTARKYPDNY
jgi:transposase InsO family protein